MWISREVWISLMNRVEKCEEELKKTKGELREETDRKIREMAKRILEMPEGLREEIRGIEELEKLVDDFLRDEEHSVTTVGNEKQQSVVIQSKDKISMAFGHTNLRKDA